MSTQAKTRQILQLEKEIAEEDRCLCGVSYPGHWTSGVHHGTHKCARVITKVTTS